MVSNKEFWRRFELLRQLTDDMSVTTAYLKCQEKHAGSVMEN